MNLMFKTHFIQRCNKDAKQVFDSSVKQTYASAVDWRQKNSLMRWGNARYCILFLSVTRFSFHLANCNEANTHTRRHTHTHWILCLSFFFFRKKWYNADADNQSHDNNSKCIRYRNAISADDPNLRTNSIELFFEMQSRHCVNWIKWENLFEVHLLESIHLYISSTITHRKNKTTT